MPLTPEEYAERVRLVTGKDAEQHALTLARVYKRRFPAADYDDLLASVRGGFWQAALRYDPTRSAVFEAYASYWAKAWVFNYLFNEFSRGVRMPRRLMKEVRVTNLTDAAADALAERETEEPPEFSPWFWLLAAVELDPPEPTVLAWRFREGLTLRECGERLGVSRERVRQLEERAVRKLRDAGFGAGMPY